MRREIEKQGMKKSWIGIEKNKKKDKAMVSTKSCEEPPT